MSMIKEFKQFAMRGNVMDMAVGIIIGAAFGKIVSTFVANVLMPPLGLLIGGINFTEFGLVLKQASGDTPAVVLGYGIFFQALIDFIIIAFAIFLVIKAMNALQKKEQEKPSAPPAPSKQELLLAEIRDILKAGK